MKPYAEMTKEELLSLRQDLKAQYHEFQAKDLKLDMSRGKPCVEQLDLSMGMMDVLSDEWIARVKARQPELRTEKIARYKEEYGLPEYDARLLTSSKHMADIFEETTRLSGRPKEASNWLMVEAMRLMKEQEMEPEDMEFSTSHLAALIRMVENNIINRTVAKTVFEEIFRHDADPEAYVEENGLKVVKDEGALRDTVKAVMAANPQSVEDYRNGREKAMGFLVGQTMKAMKGKADPSMVNQLVRELLAGGDV